MDSGLRGPSLMSEFLTHMLTLIRPLPLLPHTRSTKMRNAECMKRVLEVERASFVPVVLSAIGGMGRHASVFYKNLASLLAEKRDSTYGTTMNCLCCVTTFSLLRNKKQHSGALTHNTQTIDNTTALH